MRRMVLSRGPTTDGRVVQVRIKPGAGCSMNEF